MLSISRMPAWASNLASMTAAGMLIVAGCSALDKPENQPKQVFERIGGSGKGGQVLQPRQCLVRVLILDRPFRDPAINEVVWQVADEQLVAPEERKALAANGLRIGRVIGNLPRELETILRGEGPGQPKLEPSNILLESGQSSLVSVTPKLAEVSLLVSRDDRVTGRDYHDVSGYLKLTPRHHGARGVSLRVTPEIHHGPVRRSFPTAAAAPGPGPQQLSIRDAQKEEALNDLSVDLVLEEGQVAILGSRPDNLRSLGSFLFGQQAAENEERHQRLVLIWASRNMAGIIAEAPRGDRPRLFRRLVAAPDEPPANPAPPDPAPPAIPPPPEPTSTKKE